MDGSLDAVYIPSNDPDLSMGQSSEAMCFRVLNARSAGRFAAPVILASVMLVITFRVASAQGDAVDGEAVYATACARCHASVARIEKRIDGTTLEEKQVWLEAFLPEHHAPDDVARADLIAFLLVE